MFENDLSPMARRILDLPFGLDSWVFPAVCLLKTFYYENKLPGPRGQTPYNHTRNCVCTQRFPPISLDFQRNPCPSQKVRTSVLQSRLACLALESLLCPGRLPLLW